MALFVPLHLLRRHQPSTLDNMAPNNTHGASPPNHASDRDSTIKYASSTVARTLSRNHHPLTRKPQLRSRHRARPQSGLTNLSSSTSLHQSMDSKQRTQHAQPINIHIHLQQHALHLQKPTPKSRPRSPPPPASPQPPPSAQTTQGGPPPPLGV